MNKLTLYPCLTKDSNGSITVLNFVDLLTGTTYTPAEVAAFDVCEVEPPLEKEVQTREVCVDTNADGISDQRGLQHITYVFNLDNTTTTTSLLTELDGETILVGTIVECSETFFGTPVEVCV